MKFKVNDQVLVVSGKNKGTKSVITAVYPSDDKVLVQGVNIVTKHRKPYSGQAGEIVKFEKPISVAKVAIINEDGKPDRIGYAIKGDKKVRVFAKSKKEVPEVGSGK